MRSSSGTRGARTAVGLAACLARPAAAAALGTEHRRRRAGPAAVTVAGQASRAAPTVGLQGAVLAGAGARLAALLRTMAGVHRGAGRKQRGTWIMAPPRRVGSRRRLGVGGPALPRRPGARPAPLDAEGPRAIGEVGQAGAGAAGDPGGDGRGLQEEDRARAGTGRRTPGRRPWDPAAVDRCPTGCAPATGSAGRWR